MTNALPSAESELRDVAGDEGWSIDDGTPGELQFRKRGRGYIVVRFDTAGRVTGVSGARRANGSDPYPTAMSNRRAHAVALLRGQL